MERTILITGFLLILSGSLFLTSFFVLSYSYVSHFASILVLASGFFFIITARERKFSFFVCGECEKKFLTESDLREHYGIDHIKKDHEGKNG